ncbi:MAG: glycosyltransferase family 2 protein [Clostridia bacterium]|nr:glycosyltransferase family 2 protein [Clostridia bacterium]
MECGALYIVIPCFNEEEVLPETFRRLSQKMKDLAAKGKVSEKSKILFVDNGSSDGTWQLINEFHKSAPQLVSGLKLSKNCGHQNGLAAGIRAASAHADFVITMDADLQDDVDAADRMIDEYYGGSDIVYGVRSSRENDSFFKRTSASMFYRFMDLIGVELVPNHADYRLMSARATKSLEEFREKDLFLRGILPLTGYPSSVVTYKRAKRFAGKSKYSVKNLFALAASAIVSFSTAPLRLIPLVGALELLAGAILLLVGCFGGGGTQGLPYWPIASLFLLISGINTLLLGIAAVYIGKTYEEAKGRPRYIIENKIGMGDE